MRSYCICLSLSDYFTWHNALKVHPCCCKWQDFIQFFTTELHSIVSVQFSSVTQSRLTLCDPMDCSTPGLSVHHHLLELAQTCSNSCTSRRWCQPTILSSVAPFSSCLQSFPASGSFLMSQFFTSGAKLLELQLQH